LRNLHADDSVKLISFGLEVTNRLNTTENCYPPAGNSTRLKPRTLEKMEGTSRNRQHRYAFILSREKTGYPESSENNIRKQTIHKGAKDCSENHVLQAYGIVPVARKESSHFVLSSKKIVGNKSNSMADKWHNLSSTKRSTTEQPEWGRKEYEQAVLKAYGIVPAQGCFCTSQFR